MVAGLESNWLGFYLKKKKKADRSMGMKSLSPPCSPLIPTVCNSVGHVTHTGPLLCKGQCVPSLNMFLVNMS